MVLIENIMRFVTLRLFRVTVALSLPVSALASDAIEHEDTFKSRLENAGSGDANAMKHVSAAYCCLEVSGDICHDVITL